MTLCVGAATNLKIHRQIAGTVFIDELVADVAPLIVGPVQIDLDGAQAFFHAIDVQTEPDRLAVMHRNYFVYSIPEQESTIHRRYSCLVERHVVAVQKSGRHNQSSNPL